MRGTGRGAQATGSGLQMIYSGTLTTHTRIQSHRDTQTHPHTCTPVHTHSTHTHTNSQMRTYLYTHAYTHTVTHSHKDIHLLLRTQTLMFSHVLTPSPTHSCLSAHSRKTTVFTPPHSCPITHCARPTLTRTLTVTHARTHSGTQPTDRCQKQALGSGRGPRGSEEGKMGQLRGPQSRGPWKRGFSRRRCLEGRRHQGPALH